MAVVLLACPMDADRRAALAAFPPGGFEAVVLEDLPAADRPSAWARAEVLVCEGFRPEIPEGLASVAPRLRLVQVVLAGVNHVPFERIPPGVVVCSNAGAYSVSVAEHAMALLLAAAKDVPRRTEEVRRGVFDQASMSKPLRGSTLLVVGMGGIGAEVARIARAFGMSVLGIGRPPPGAAAEGTGTMDDLEPFAARADYVVIALPLTQSTEGLIGRRALEAMKDDAVLVNVARGKIVVEDDLYEHLRTHPRFRAALDVWWTYPGGREGRPFRRPFHELPNVVMTPHVAFANPDQRGAALTAALENVARFVRGEAPRNVVDPSDYAPVDAPDHPSDMKPPNPLVRNDKP